MDSDSDGECSSKKDNTLWNKITLGISAASKSISRTPAQDRLARLRNKLIEDQKKKTHEEAAKMIASMKSDLVQLRSTNAFGTKTLAQRKPKSEKSSLQARLKLCVEKPSKNSPKTLIPATEVCNQLNLISKSLDPRERVRKNLVPDVPKRNSLQEIRSKTSSTETSSSITKNKCLDLKNDGKPPTAPMLSTLKDITEQAKREIQKSRKRKSKEAEESPIQEKIVRKTIETNLVEVKEGRLTKKLSANDRLQRLRDTLKKQKDKKATDKISVESSIKPSNEPEIKPSKEASGNSQKVATTQPAVEKMDVDDEDTSLFKEPEKPEPASCSTSLSSNIAAFFRSFRNEIASAFTSHSENVSIREKYNKTISKVKSKDEISEKDCIYVIPDTNIFIHHLTCIKDILEQPIQNNKTVRIFVPYIVIEELDRLKEQRDKSVSTTAMRAVKYLNEKLENQDTSLQGQTIVDSIDHLIPVKYPDDSILNCCLQMKRKGNTFLLLSNDINLRNKALVNNVKALASADVDVENIVKFC